MKSILISVFLAAVLVVVLEVAKSSAVGVLKAAVAGR